MPEAKLIYRRNEVCEVVRRHAQALTGEIVLASRMQQDGEGNWVITLDPPKPIETAD